MLEKILVFWHTKDLMEFDMYVSVTKSIWAVFGRRLKTIRARFSNVSG